MHLKLRGWKMERLCKNPNCKSTLSSFVPEYVQFCSRCQLIIIRLREKHPYWNDGDAEFVVAHSTGCAPFELADHLGINRSSFYGYLNKGNISLSQKTSGRRLHIPVSEIIRAIILHREFVSISPLAKITGMSLNGLYKYINRGYLAGCIRNLRGALSLHISRVMNIKDVCQRIQRDNLSRRRWHSTPLGDNQLTVTLIARIMHVSDVAVRYLMNRGYLPYFQVRTGRIRIVNLSDFLEFAKRAINGQYPSLRSSTISNLKRFLHGRNSLQPVVVHS